MGSGSSIQVINSVEVSFIDNKTGKLLPEKDIIELSDKVCKDFDYKPSYYAAYKPDKCGNNPYQIYASNLKKVFPNNSEI